MFSSDEEDEDLLLSVSNYHFEDDEKEPVSFSELPMQWTEGERTDGKKVKLFLDGDTDNGLQKVYKHVVAWKFDISNEKPEISVLSKENSWIKLQKPRKSFENIIRSILVTVHCLHFVLRNPEASRKSLWDQLSKICSSCEVRPSENDLVDHMSLITEAVERNDALAKSKLLVEFLKEKPGKRRLPDEEIQAKSMSKFIVSDSDDDIMDGGEDDESSEDDGLFDSACSICDNGGQLLCCEGSCLRSFHATVEAGEDCDSLGFNEEEVNAMQQFLCKNCKYKQQQCFICGKLGSSDRYSGAEVFRCVSATCGRFYHPCCVAKFLHGDNEVSADDLEKKIADGQSFTCPVHKCFVCKQGENKKDHQLQFAVCRRCPKSYHRKCLPKKIAFESNEEEGIIQRAWEDLLPNRILIYCLKHKIDEEVGTPIRNHIKFPGDEDKKSTLAKKKSTIDENREKRTSELLGDKKKIESKARGFHAEVPCQGRTASAHKQTKKLSSGLKLGVNKSSGKLASGSSIPRKVKVNGAAKKEPPKSPRTKENKSSLGVRLFELVNESSEPVRQEEQDTAHGDLNTAAIARRNANLSSGLPPLDADSEKRVLDIMNTAESSIRVEGIRAKQELPSTYVSLQKYFEDKAITHGRVETSVQAVREALRRLDEGGSIQDAEVVCSPELLVQIFKWKNKLKTYLAPFLHGMRYTSFGRHFTKVEKVDQIVNRLHWYVQNGDMVVDFCCGANDFSILMEKKLDEMGKKCSFKNYDLFPPKIDFNFEKRDWMSVKPDELPTGSKLIMGLNPPFGIKGALANRFIDKALEFNPKLLILIVPSETQRLDEKKAPYDLVWEDDHLLSGKSFYLPGSINARDKQMEQWNMTPPLLYLWSRPDWSAEHRLIAETHGHISQQKQEDRERSEPMIPDRPTGNHVDDDRDVYDLPMGGDDDNADIPRQAMDADDHYGDNPILNDGLMETDNLKGYGAEVVGTEVHRESSPSSSGERGSPEIHGRGKKLLSERSRKRPRSGRKNKRRVSGRVSTEKKWDGERPAVREIHNTRMPSYAGAGNNSYQHPEPYIPTSHAPLAYHDDTERRSPVREIYNTRMPLYTGGGENTHPHLEANIPVSHAPLAYDDSTDRRYIIDDEHCSRFSNRLSSDPSAVAEYGVRNLEGNLFMGQARDAADGLSGRHLDESIRPQARFYGQQDLHLPASNYSRGQDQRFPQIVQLAPLSSGYGHLGTAGDTPYRMSPTGTQWFQARPDELHHNRMSTFGSEPLQPLPYGNGGLGPHRFGPPRLPHYGHPGGPAAFAPGRHEAYQHHGSGGWIP